MVFKVKLSEPAERDAYAAFEYIREESPEAAERWLGGLFQAIFSLAEMPRRCPVIEEAGEIGLQVRHLLFGRRSGIFRIIFDIDETSPDGPCVRVLRIWHAARDRIRVEDLEEE